MNSMLLIGLVAAILILANAIVTTLLLRDNRRLRAALVRPLPEADRPAVVDEVEILQRVGDDWRFHSTRPVGHRDIEEALDTPGLAVRRGGVTLKGRQ